jgi:hypothetical protein
VGGGRTRFEPSMGDRGAARIGNVCNGDDETRLMTGVAVIVWIGIGVTASASDEFVAHGDSGSSGAGGGIELGADGCHVIGGGAPAEAKCGPNFLVREPRYQ